ncbi:hypothetical protein D9756_007216 [Leucocoprinus leucothites]|uniref:Transmembrane protein n=1 Tax=Leucocoprinus leucothites TaxID=201217 RepID=A0A8H5D7A5_9AGAR|nr:hypothetical protein D9756_007216 [Leucoagaricus leucothites]
MTAISVIWHALATFTVREILLQVFSAEWMELARQNGKVVFRETDVVSRITTGYIDQITHFGSKRATTPFRLGFICTLLLLVLNGLGPSAINVNLISIQKPTRVRVANLTITENWNNVREDGLASYRADLITRLEQLEDSFYGFRGEQPNVLIPWLSSDLISANSTIRYQSGVNTFNFNCSWQVPSPLFEPVTKGESGNIIDNQVWNMFTEASNMDPGDGIWANASAFFLLKLDTLLTRSIPSHPTYLAGQLGSNSSASSPLSGFIFATRNIAVPDGRVLNLEGIPTTLASRQLGPSTNGTDLLITVLLCDPQFKISPATVTLKGGTLSADMQSGSRVVNNIPPEAADTIFSQCLLFATSTQEPWDGTLSVVNSIVRILFLTDPAFEYTPIPGGTKPLPLDEINRRMNKILLSSAKAYLSGYRPDFFNFTFPAFEMIDSDAIGEVEQLALVGSRPFLIALMVVVAVLVVLLITLVAMVRADQLQTFDLENIVKALRIH